jgi:hypothetical protein
MKAKIRRKLEMGRRALEFGRAHPDTSPGYTAALTRLEERLGRADTLAGQQRQGMLEVRAATARKHELRRTMTVGHLDHLVSVARVAARELPELSQKFVLTRTQQPYLAFRTTARGMAAEAMADKELLVRHGLVDTVLEDLGQALDEFDAAVEQGTVGRRAHVGASAELATVADEVVQIVKVMDGLNRVRFASEPEQLVAWESASNVVATPRAAPAAPEVPSPAPGEVRPAA